MLMLEWVAVTDLFAGEAFVGVWGLLGCVSVAYNDGAGMVETGVGGLANLTWSRTKDWLGVSEAEIFSVLYRLSHEQAEEIEPYESYLFLVVTSALLGELRGREMVIEEARALLVRPENRFSDKRDRS